MKDPNQVLESCCLKLLDIVAPWVEDPISLERDNLLKSKRKIGISSSQYGFDIRAEDALRGFLKENFPEFAFFGEERYWEDSNPRESNILVVADCVDGSTVLARMAKAGIAYDQNEPLQAAEIDGKRVLVDTDAVGSHITVFDKESDKLFSAVIDYAEKRIVFCDGESIRISQFYQEGGEYKLGRMSVFNPPDSSNFQNEELVVIGAFASDIRKEAAEQFMRRKGERFMLHGRYIGAVPIARIFAGGRQNSEMRNAVEGGRAVMMSLGKGRPLYELLFIFPFFRSWQWSVYRREGEGFCPLSHRDIIDMLINSPGDDLGGDKRLEFIAGPENVISNLLKNY